MTTRCHTRIYTTLTDTTVGAATEAVEEWLDQRDPLWSLFSSPGQSGESEEG